MVRCGTGQEGYRPGIGMVRNGTSKSSDCSETGLVGNETGPE